jgi:hypothetical protein
MESCLSRRICSGNEIAREIKHHGTRQQQREKTREPEHGRDQGDSRTSKSRGLPPKSSATLSAPMPIGTRLIGLGSELDCAISRISSSELWQFDFIIGGAHLRRM